MESSREKPVGEAASGSVIPGTGRAPGVADLYLRRTRSEMELLAGAGISMAGSAFGTVLLVKGEPGEAERSGARLLSGADGAALRAALSRLGYADDDWGAVSTYRVPDFSAADALDVATAVEAFDPELVIALDPTAASQLAAAWSLARGLYEGAVERVMGRRVLALGGFEAALADPAAKQLMWSRLKLVAPLPAPL